MWKWLKGLFIKEAEDDFPKEWVRGARGRTALPEFTAPPEPFSPIVKPIVEVRAVVTRANGTVEDLGVISRE